MVIIAFFDIELFVPSGFFFFLSNSTQIMRFTIFLTHKCSLHLEKSQQMV